MPSLNPDTIPDDSDNELDNYLLNDDMSPKLYLPVIVEPICLANEIDAINDDNEYTFGQRRTEFGIYNCVTHHICSDKSFFVGEIQQCSNIEVKVVAGSAVVEGIGTIEF